MRIQGPCSGFTLIELMVVVIIIAALASMVLPRVLPASTEAKANISRGDIAQIGVGLKMFYLHNDRFPTTEEGLNALIEKPGSVRNWNGPYLERKPLDPWKRPYQYKYPTSHPPHSYDLWSLGPDDRNAGDDIANWQD